MILGVFHEGEFLIIVGSFENRPFLVRVGRYFDDRLALKALFTKFTVVEVVSWFELQSEEGGRGRGRPV